MQAASNIEKPGTMPGFSQSLAFPHTSPHPAIIACTSAQGVFSLHSVQAAEDPDQQDDRQRNADEPKQKTASHGCLQLECHVP
jgi:hypothetical protein